MHRLALRVGLLCTSAAGLGGLQVARGEGIFDSVKEVVNEMFSVPDGE